MFNRSMPGQDFRLSLYATNIPWLVSCGWRYFRVILIIKYGCILNDVNFILVIRDHYMFCRGSLQDFFPVEILSVAFFFDFKMNF